MRCTARFRQRWRDFTTLAADLVFETDAEGRFSFVAPEAPLGWSAEALLGRPGRDLLAMPKPDPFLLHGAARGLRAWLRRPDGGTACLSLSLAPLHDSAGRFVGLRGSGRDITAEVAEAEAQAAALRRAEALQSLVGRVRREVLAPRMLTATLEAMQGALGCAGAAVLEWPEGGGPVAIHRHGAEPRPLLAGLAPRPSLDAPAFLDGPGGECLALVPQQPQGVPQGGRPQALLAWRDAGQRDFDADDRHMLAALSDFLFVVLGNQALQQRLECQARTDALTGLLNRRAFLEDLGRRLRRQAQDPLRAGRAEGALLFLDLDNFKPINDRLGHEAGDAALVSVAGLLRELVRPTDMAARLGGDEFALWLEDADAAGAAGRAAAVCAAAARLDHRLGKGVPPITFSIGGAIRQPGTAETPEALLARADAAMYDAKRGGRDAWVLAAPDEPPRRLAS
ncbi:diguanylate cyclase domain-containing protein [Dankookia sp. P2]|uniref:GGDEF domain-containing protein n=1 Tax=Dankookia sp. P2 TaxID=3423955 RepID=UPI003D67D828